MRSLPALTLLLVLSTLPAAHAVEAQEGGAGGPGRSGSGRAAGPAGARGPGVEAMRERHADRGGPDRGPGDLRGDPRARRREREALLSPEDRALLAERRSRGETGPRAARSPDQQAFAQALRDKRRELRASVSAGTLDRHAAAEQLRAWLRGNGPATAPSP